MGQLQTNITQNYSILSTPKKYLMVTIFKSASTYQRLPNATGFGFGPGEG
jgi:hypothetical protein